MTNKPKKNQPVIDNLPKGIGISRKIVMVVMTLLLFLFGFVFIMVFHYRGNKPIEKPKQQSNLLVQQQNGISPEDAINELNRNATNGVLSTANTKLSQAGMGQGTSSAKAANQQTTQQPSQAGLNNQDKVQAASSTIAVMNNFRGPDQSLSNQSTNGSANNSSQPVNPFNTLAQNPMINAGGKSGEGYQQQNMQNEKAAFLQSAQQPNNKFYLSSALTQPVSPFEVKAGTVIPATLLTGINSDLPGQITAQISQAIYDTVTGNYLLIPQGTKVIGVYDSQVAYGQTRVLIAWSRLIYPNGDSFDLQGQPGVDLTGMSGLHDLVNNHYVRIFGSALMFSMFGAIGQLSQPQQTNGVLTNQQIIYGAIGQQMSQTGAQLIEKNMNIQPTIQIRQGTNFNILLTRDMVLPGPYRN